MKRQQYLLYLIWLTQMEKLDHARLLVQYLDLLVATSMHAEELKQLHGHSQMHVTEQSHILRQSQLSLLRKPHLSMHLQMLQ
ncbi:MAG: hypothetical protein IPI60_06175 [Saprospiraceae bacterium]|nr:hypothetical protein [Saprospiraceae bacterium]